MCYVHRNQSRFLSVYIVISILITGGGKYILYTISLYLMIITINLIHCSTLTIRYLQESTYSSNFEVQKQLN